MTSCLGPLIKCQAEISTVCATWFDALTADRATGIVDEPRRPRFKAYTNYDNYVALTTWTKIVLNTIEANDQGAFDAATNLFTAPVAGTYLFGATLLYKVNSSTSARMRGRLVLNGVTEIRGRLARFPAPTKRWPPRYGCRPWCRLAPGIL